MIDSDPRPAHTCFACETGAREKARDRMTKAQLREDLRDADEVYVNLSESESMYKAYVDALEAHLRAHGCSCDFGDVADEPERLAVAEAS